MMARLDVLKHLKATESTPVILWVIGVALATLLVLLSISLFYRLSENYIFLYLTFWSSLIAVGVLVSAPAIGNSLAGCLNKLAAFLQSRGSFCSDVQSEIPKFAILRVVFGALMLERAIWIIIYMFPSDWESPLLVLIVLLSALTSAMVCIGLFAQVALTYLIVVQWQVGDHIIGTATLGNDIAAMLALLMIFANAGAHYSLDAVVRKRRGFLGRVVAATYYESGIVKENTLQIAKFLSLTAYWCVCVYSLVQHINESSWMNGSAGPLLLTSNFMSRYSEAFSYFFELGSWQVLLGKIGIWAMLPWYFLLLPCVLLGGRWRMYAIVWGLLFFSLSLFVLQLGWLAHFEFLFFAGLFWQSAFMRPRGSLKIAYDDRCNLCDRTVNVLKRVDIFGRVELRPVSKNADWLAQNDIRPSDAMIDLYGVETSSKNRKASGYDLYIKLTQTIFLLLPFFPILILGKWLGIGPLLYRYIADRRTRIFGVCQIPTRKPDSAIKIPPSKEKALSRSDPINLIAAHLSFLASVYLLLVPAPSLGWSGMPLPWPASVAASNVRDAAHLYGITPIDVFNKRDLRMAENWFTLTFIADDGRRIRTPVFREDGERLSMHASDRVYFGHTVRFRRELIGRSGCVFEDYEEMLRKFAEYHMASIGDVAGHFLYTQYLQPLPDPERIVAGRFVPNRVESVCSREFR